MFHERTPNINNRFVSSTVCVEGRLNEIVCRCTSLQLWNGPIPESINYSVATFFTSLDVLHSVRSNTYKSSAGSSSCSWISSIKTNFSASTLTFPVVLRILFLFRAHCGRWQDTPTDNKSRMMQHPTGCRMSQQESLSCS